MVDRVISQTDSIHRHLIAAKDSDIKFGHSGRVLDVNRLTGGLLGIHINIL